LPKKRIALEIGVGIPRIKTMSNIAVLLLGWVTLSAVMTPIVSIALFTHPRIR
jgi:hypothetical protein